MSGIDADIDIEALLEAPYKVATIHITIRIHNHYRVRANHQTLYRNQEQKNEA